MTGAALCDPRCAEFVAGTALCWVLVKGYFFNPGQIMVFPKCCHEPATISADFQSAATVTLSMPRNSATSMMQRTLPDFVGGAAW